MLTFEQKLDILQSYPELERRNVSLGRVNFHYEDSVHDKKTVAYHIHPNGNGFIYAGLLKGYPVDEKGLVNIREYTEDELRQIVEQSIRSLSIGVKDDNSVPNPDPAITPSGDNEILRKESPGGIWIDPSGQLLTLKYADDLWYIYSGQSVEMVFETREEAGEYLAEEGFTPQKI